jgi:hypothetical protein
MTSLNIVPRRGPVIAVRRMSARSSRICSSFWRATFQFLALHDQGGEGDGPSDMGDTLPASAREAVGRRPQSMPNSQPAFCIFSPDRDINPDAARRGARWTWTSRQSSFASPFSRTLRSKSVMTIGNT